MSTFSNDDQGMADVGNDDKTVTTPELRQEMDERLRQMGEEMDLNDKKN